MSGDSGDTRGDAKTYSLELTQLFDRVIYLLSTGPLWVDDGFGVVENYNHLPRGQEGSQGPQVFGVLYPRADGLGELAEEMSVRRRESVATDETTVFAEPFLDTVVVEDG